MLVLLLVERLNQCFRESCFLPKGKYLFHNVLMFNDDYHCFGDSEMLVICREKLNSMNLLLYMAPVAVMVLLPATLLMEDNVVGITVALARNDVKIIWYLMFNSTLAYFVNLTNFLVTKHTSALTLQVFSMLWNFIRVYTASIFLLS